MKKNKIIANKRQFEANDLTLLTNKKNGGDKPLKSASDEAATNFPCTVLDQVHFKNHSA